MSRRGRQSSPPRGLATTPLSKRYRRRGWANPREAVNAAIGLTIAVERAHADGHLHGAITPDAVSVRQDGGVILHPPAGIDAGTGPADATVDVDPHEIPVDMPTAVLPPIEAAPAEVTAAGDMPTIRFAPVPAAGDAPPARDATPYDPPGFAPSAPATPADDVYSVGAVFFEMLTGTTPGGLGVDDLRAVVARRQDVPLELATVAVRAVHPDPRDRYASATALRTDLEAARLTLPPPGRAASSASSTRRRNLILLGVAILAALLAGLWFFLLRGDAVAVPNVVGQTQSQAETTIRDAGFTPQATYEWDSSLATGYVVRTDPAAGTKRDKGSTVTIVVSGAGGGTPEQISVPAVTGLQESDATTALTNAGLVPSITRVSDAASAGTVIQQTPTASSNVPSGSTVTLTVSTGPTSTGTTTSPDTTVPDTTETTETETTETTFPDTTGTVESPPDPRGEDAAPFTDTP